AAEAVLDGPLSHDFGSGRGRRGNSTTNVRASGSGSARPTASSAPSRRDVEMTSVRPETQPGTDSQTTSHALDRGPGFLGEIPERSGASGEKPFVHDVLPDGWHYEKGPPKRITSPGGG